MKTKLLAFAVIILFIFPSSGAYDNTYVNIISKEFVNVNEFLYVNISIEPASPLGGAQCDISFNPSVLEIESVNGGGMFEEWWNANLEIDNVNGTVKNMIAFNFGGNGTTENGIFAVVKLRAKSVGFSYLNLSNVIVSDENGDEISSVISNGFITVVNDTTPPAISYSLNPATPDGNNDWYISDVEVTLNATDEHGISEMKYRVDGNAWQDYTSPFTVSDSGEHTVTFYAIDGAGNNNSTLFNIKIDKVLPTVSHSLNPSTSDGSNGWYVSNVEVTISSADSTSGISVTKYRIDNGVWQDYTAPFPITDDGQHTVDYYAVDNAGNNASSETFSLKIDSANPPSLASLSGTKEGDVYTTDVTVSISRTDSTSGIAYTKYRTNGGTWTTYNSPFTLTEDGTYTVDYYSVDNAGNTESAKTVTFEILKNHPPTADFTYTPANPTRANFVHFSDKSTGSIISRHWNFGDGSTSTDINPSHKYSDMGTFTVTLTVRGPAENDTDTKSKQITVSNAEPVASFSYSPPNPVVGQTVAFDASASYDPDGSITSYSWNFGDGTGSGNNIQHTYQTAGTYSVTLTVTDNNGASTSIQKNIVVKVEKTLPVASFSYTPLHPSTSDEIQFSDSSYDEDGNIIGYEWDFGDGNVSYKQNPVHKYAINGTYNVTLTVTDNDGGTSTTSETLEVSSSLPDLVLEDIQYPSLEKGNIKVTVKIKNIGSKDATGFSCILYIDGENYGTEFIDKLNAGEGRQIYFHPQLSEGKHFLNASVDPGNLIDEIDEKNNYRNSSITVSPSPPLTDWRLIVAVVAGVVALSIVLVFLIRRKKTEAVHDGKKMQVKPEEEIHRCFICLGKIKPGSPFVTCECGAIFHKSCAERVKECPNCGKELIGKR